MRSAGLWLLAGTTFSSLYGSAFANVIGVDLGVDYMKVALVAPRKPLEIVTNTASKRKTEMAINFDRGERSFGSDAYVLLSRKPRSTFIKLTTLLGRGPDHPTVLAFRESGVPCDLFFNTTRGGHAVRMEDGGGDTTFFVEELVAMILGHARDITKNFGHVVKDAVVTVPEFFTVHERQAVLDAAELAGLSVLTLIDENTAAALQFGIDRTFDEDHTVLFYNMGANSVQVTVATYGPKMDKGKNVGQVTVRGKAWDMTLGASWFDLELTDMLAEGFNKKWGKGDVRKFERPMGKIRSRAAKVKEVLSANTAIPVTLESLHEDVDFTTSVTRSDFEKRCAPLFARLTAPIEAALTAANASIAAVDVVEIIGGGVRIPKVQDTLKDYLAAAKAAAAKAGGGSAAAVLAAGSEGEGSGGGPELGVHLNGDESMALGAAFRGANISRAFAVRQIGVADITPFAVDVSLRDAAPATATGAAGGGGGVLGGLFGGGKKVKEETAAAKAATAAAGGEDGGGAAGGEGEGEPYFKEHNLYAAGALLPVKRTFTFTHAADMEVNMTYAVPGADTNPQLPEGTQRLIATYAVGGIAKFAKEMAEAGHGTPKVALRFAVDTNGIPTLASAEAFVEYEKEVTYEVLIDAEEDEKKKDAKAATDGNDAAKVDGTGDAAKVEDGDDDAAAEDAVAGQDAATEAREGDAANAEQAGAEEGGDLDGSGDAANRGEKEKGGAAEKKDGKVQDKDEDKPAKGRKAKAKKTVTKTKMVTDRKKRKLGVERVLAHMVVRPMTAAEKAASKARLAALDAADEARRLRAEAKNGLEAYILSVRSALDDDDRSDAVAAVSTEEQRAAALALARELEDWLYEEGWDEDTATYKKKRAELALPAEAIFLRAREATDRPAAVETARKSLAKVVEMVEKWKTAKPHITDDEREEVLAKVAAAEAWLAVKEAEQAAIRPHDAPAFVSTDIEPHLKVVKGLVAKHSKKPPPPPPKKEALKPTVGNDTHAGGGGNSTEPEGASGEGGGAGGAEGAEGSEAGGDSEGGGGVGSDGGEEAGAGGDAEADHDEL